MMLCMVRLQWKRFVTALTRIATVSLLYICVVTNVSGADEEGKFVSLGVGVAKCEQFLIARQQQSNDYYLFGGWIDGYLSARNQLDQDTYTLTPWQRIDVLAGFLTDYCVKNRDVAFQRAVMVMAEALKPQRLSKSSEMVEIAVSSGLTTTLFKAVLVSTQNKLIEKGYGDKFISGKPTGKFDETTIEAIKKYQKQLGMTETGFLDQITLFAILRDTEGQ